VVEADGSGESLARCPVPMMVTPSGAILLRGGVFKEHRLSPHHGLVSLGENLDPRLVKK
jgi:hypothetical protein